MENIIIVAVLAAILGGAVWYIRKSKKAGIKCVGCPHAAACAASKGGCGGNCGGEG